MNSRINPLITIIVGIYNGEKYLKECLDSIVNQTYNNIEIILINDGSTDESLKIINEYKSIDSRVIVINQKNQGVSISRNKALDISKGEYICIVDQDDVLDLDYVKYFYDLIIETDSEIALTPCTDKFFGRINNVKKMRKYKVVNGRDAVIEMLYHKFVIAPWNKMISKRIIDKYNIRFNPNFYCGEGFAFSIECFQRAEKVVISNDKIYHYRVGDPETGASKYKEFTINSSINAQQYIRDNLIFKDDEVQKAWVFSNWHTHCDSFNIMVGCHAKNKNIELYKKLMKVAKSDALCAFSAPISFQQKLRGFLFKINPYFAAKIINKFRVRKFKKEI